MMKDLTDVCGLPVSFDEGTGELALGAELNSPSYCTRKLHDLDPVWADKVNVADRVI